MPLKRPKARSKLENWKKSSSQRSKLAPESQPDGESMSEKNGRLRGRNWAQSFKLGGDEGLLGHDVVGCGKKAHGHNSQLREYRSNDGSSWNQKSLTWGTQKEACGRKKEEVEGGLVLRGRKRCGLGAVKSGRKKNAARAG